MAFGSKRIKGTGSITAGNSAKAAGYHRCDGCGRWTQCSCDSMKRGAGRARSVAEAERRFREDQQDREAEDYLRKHGRLR